MTFDDELKRAFDTLSGRLRDELDRQVHAAVEELSVLARRDAEEAASRAAEEASTRAAEAAARAAEQAASVTPAPQLEPVEEPRPHRESTTVVDGMNAIDRARSLGGILDALIAAAADAAGGAGVWLVRNDRLACWRSDRIERSTDDVALDANHVLAQAARTNAPATGDDGFAVPLALAGETVAVLWVPAGAAGHRHDIEALARYAARCLESMTAFKTARALSDGASTVTQQTAAVSRPAPTAAASDDEHASAQRYARLLVSEIKLYHEQAVAEGRRDGDLGTRLGGEIARARAMYDQRVPPRIRDVRDHFHDELVRTLADGDRRLLEART